MNQNTRWAIKERFPMRWEPDGIGGFGVKLIATTYTYENGNVRERKVFRTFSRTVAAELDAQVREAGGKLAGPGPDAVYDEWRERQEEQWQRIRIDHPALARNA